MILNMAAGAITGLLAVGLFGLSHAIFIVPIWSRLAGGIPFGAVAGLALGWARWEFKSLRQKHTVAAQGLSFGLFAWCTVLPATAFAALIRILGLHAPESAWEPAVSVALALATGSAIGYVLERRIRAAVAGAAGGLTLIAAMAGPIPVTNSLRAMLLFVSFAVIIPICGLSIAQIASALHRLLPTRTALLREPGPLPQHNAAEH